MDEDARAGYRLIQRHAAADEQVLRFVEQQHRVAGRREALRQPQAGKPFAAFRLFAVFVSFGDGAQAGTGPRREGRCE
jgi:hypothetical protein